MLPQLTKSFAVRTCKIFVLSTEFLDPSNPILFPRVPRYFPSPPLFSSLYNNKIPLPSSLTHQSSSLLQIKLLLIIKLLSSRGRRGKKKKTWQPWLLQLSLLQFRPPPISSLTHPFMGLPCHLLFYVFNPSNLLVPTTCPFLLLLLLLMTWTLSSLTPSKNPLFLVKWRAGIYKHASKRTHTNH